MTETPKPTPAAEVRPSYSTPLVVRENGVDTTISPLRSIGNYMEVAGSTLTPEETGKQKLQKERPEPQAGGNIYTSKKPGSNWRP